MGQMEARLAAAATGRPCPLPSSWGGESSEGSSNRRRDKEKRTREKKREREKERERERQRVLWGQPSGGGGVQGLRRPKQVPFCTGVSANFDYVICLMYLRFAERNLKQSALWSNYPQKCMFSAQKSICLTRQITYIFLVEAQNLRYSDIHALLFYFRTSQHFVMIFFKAFSWSLTEESG